MTSSERKDDYDYLFRRRKKREKGSNAGGGKREGGRHLPGDDEIAPENANAFKESEDARMYFRGRKKKSGPSHKGEKRRNWRTRLPRLDVPRSLGPGGVALQFLEKKKWG